MIKDRPGFLPGLFLYDYQYFFATPFYRANEEDGVLAADITRCCLDMQSKEFEKPDPPQGRIPGVFESNFNFLDQSEDRIQDLRLLIQKHLVSFLAVINDSTPEDIASYRMGYHSWFHHYQRGLLQGAYAPTRILECGLLCQQRDDEPHQPHNMGDIVFYDPRGNASMFLDPTNRSMRRELSFNSFKITPRSGDLMIFPSFITHFVEPYQGELPRVTIAANYWVTT